MSKELLRELLETYSKKTNQKLFPYLYSAMRDGFDEDKDWVYYSGPNWTDDEPLAAIETLLNGKWLCYGSKILEFEQEFAKKFNFKKAVMVNSGSSANLVMISAIKKRFDWKDDDEVILSAVGFPTTLAPLIQNKLKPVLVDISMDDLNFNLGEVKKNITPRSKAIFISPVLGNPPDMDRLQAIAEKNDLLLILDDCDSLGSKWKGRDLSDYCVASSFSFYPAHHISTGEGGMVASNDVKIVNLARSFSTWGRACVCTGTENLSKEGVCNERFKKWLPNYDRVVDHRYIFSNIGYNMKPLDCQGAIGLEQLKKIDDGHHKRRVNKVTIAKIFEDNIKGVRVPTEHENAETGWFAIPIICDSNELKVKLVDHLESNRIQTRNYFAGNILLHPAYQYLDDSNAYPQSNLVLDRVFFVGCHPSYDEVIFNYFEKVIKSFSL